MLDLTIHPMAGARTLTFHDHLVKAAERHAGGRLRVAVAWARGQAVTDLLEAVQTHSLKLEVIVGVSMRGTTREAVSQLFRVASSLRIRPDDQQGMTFHPKVYVFDGGTARPRSLTALVGSSNLTPGGFHRNMETSVQFTVEAVQDDATHGLVSTIERMWHLLTKGAGGSSVIESESDIERLHRESILTEEKTLAEQAHSRPSGSTRPWPLPIDRAESHERLILRTFKADLISANYFSRKEDRPPEYKGISAKKGRRVSWGLGEILEPTDLPVMDQRFRVATEGAVDAFRRYRDHLRTEGFSVATQLASDLIGEVESQMPTRPVADQDAARSNDACQVLRRVIDHRLGEGDVISSVI